MESVPVIRVIGAALQHLVWEWDHFWASERSPLWIALPNGLIGVERETAVPSSLVMLMFVRWS